MDHFSEGLFDFAEAGLKNGAAGVKDNVPARGKLTAVESKGLAEAAFDPVAVDGAAHGSRDGEAQARAEHLRTFAGKAECREQGAGDAETMVIDKSEVGGAKDPAGARKGQRSASLLWRTGRLFRR